MYYTDEFSGEMQHNCMRYTVLHDIADNSIKPLLQHQFILYCFRPFQNTNLNRKNETNLDADNIENVFSTLNFGQLKMQNISPSDLFTWSAPFDLTERYAAYLINHTDVNGDFEQVFRNCTLPWFGSKCQYTFDTKDSFSNVVRSAFQRKHLDDKVEDQNTSCYIHLSCEYRSWAPMCLDWREICDGKIDCIDSAIDEQNCFNLEMNECEENEYRCRNGLCIPQEFLRDDHLNPECLDQTDEFYGTIYHQCSSDPSFRCEEHTCKKTRNDYVEFPCGDGECKPFGRVCTNGRGSWNHTRGIFFESHDLCWISMFCLTRLDSRITNNIYERWCNNITGFTPQNIIRKYCPAIFEFPTDFRLYGHIRFLYTNNVTMLIDSGHIYPPYVCYQKHLCEFLPPTISLTISKNESLTCRHFHELNLSGFIQWTWKNIVSEVHNLFRVCSSIDNSTYCLNDTMSLFRCPNSKKCIPKHRLVDSVRDCGGNEDETFESSCSLNDKYRFKCQIDGRCIAPALVVDGMFDCLDGADEERQADLERKKRIFFQTLCDGFVELASIITNVSEETDESDCEHWPCNNTYTRCDGFWNCLNGADEINCPSMSICPPLEHICISSVSYNITCLPIDKVTDGKIDCLGSTDERQYCRKAFPRALDCRFRCISNPGRCISTTELCDSRADCSSNSNEDEYFCSSTNRGVCKSFWNKKRTVSEELLCKLDETTKPVIVYFALKNFPNYPLSPSSPKQLPIQHLHYASPSISQTISHLPLTSWPSRWRCNRGLNIRSVDEYQCLCPPSYYGSVCEYQNQRVSLTIRVRLEAEWRIVFAFLITLIDNDEHLANSYDQFSYIGIRDCNTKFNMYLLYANRSKDVSRNYSIRIDAFDKHSFNHRATWLYPLHFSMLPVHRTAVYLIIPWIVTASSSCNLNCNHGHCIYTVNNPKNIICQCDHGWSGKHCHIKQKYQCSPPSLYMGSINNRSICLCPIDMFGPRCFLTQTICQSQPCHHSGQCIPNDFGRRNKLEYFCLCKEGYSGDNCKQIDTRIEILFQSNIKIPSSILAHFISFNGTVHPTRITLFKKIGFNQNSAVLFTFIQFRLLFIEFDKKYYFAFHQSIQLHLQSISTIIIPSHRCLLINELFNSTIINFHTLRRLKYYHVPCQEHIDLVCFYDSIYMCLCKTDRHVDCFEFVHNIAYNCLGQKLCANDAECFEDDSVCPTASTCVCKDCFYGNRCQYSTKGFDLSLDIILGYHIQSNLAFSKQPIIVRVSTALVIVMFVIGLIGGVFSILTFRTENSQKVGCGIYLLTTSVVSILMVIMFSWKMFLLIASHMNSITRRSFLLNNCVIIDFFLRILLSTNDWLNACVATERAMTIVKGASFNLKKSKVVSKYIIIMVLLVVIATTLHDPFHRKLVNDLEDSNTWCVINYSPAIVLFNSLVLIFHFLVPFIINIISAILIIIMTTRQRSSAQKHLTRKEHFHVQFRQHKHLLISSCILIVLAFPRLIMSFLSGCMSSSRDSWFFLVGYFISYIPPILTFFVFVLPSETYKKQFLLSIKRR